MSGVDLRQDVRRAFSLVEVLIAILVLAIGMLGLGAVFPAIIAEQRSAFDSIEGENAASVAAALINNPELVEFSLLSTDFNRPIRTGGPIAVGSEPRYSYEWVVPQDGFTYNGWTSPIPGMYGFAGFQAGLWSFNANDSDVNDTIKIVQANPQVAQIPVSARLFPQPYSGKDPKYVWDLALRREPSGNQVQAAIFVRRVDARIRVPSDYSLSDALTGGNGFPGGRALLPVAIDPMTGRTAVDDGNGKFYAAIQMLEVEVYKEHLDWLIFVGGRNQGVDTSVGFAIKVGQKLLDNTGVVRTVVGLPTVASDDALASRLSGQDRAVIVDPPFIASAAGGDETGNARSRSNFVANSDYDDERASYVRQVIFTPRTPVTIRLVTLEDAP